MGFGTILVYTSIYIGILTTTFFILSFLSDKKSKKLLFSDSELPSVSILIPAYNEEKSIAKTIKSILSTNYPYGKMEILVIDDGSKDKTYQIAKKYIGFFNGKRVRVYTKKNEGKARALNFLIPKIRTDFFFSMDADTFVKKDAVIEMVRYFKDPSVMSVTSSMTIYKPSNFLQKLQYIEYILGIFMRKSFASINSVYITPGAFSAYRKEFVDKYGGYDSGNITEDLELSLRIQSKGYKIENAPDAIAYTIAPSSFKALTSQRKRWYVGLMKNTWKYRHIFGPNYGDLGMFVFPMVGLSILFSIVLVINFFLDSFRKVINEFLFFNSIGWDLKPSLSLGKDFFWRFLFDAFSNPVVIFSFIFIGFLIIYLTYAKKKIGNLRTWKLGLAVYLILFAFLFGFWWIISVFSLVLKRTIKWK